MRYLIISDIHGCPTNLEHILSVFEKDAFDYLVILGDILYHGPRNPIPEGYNPQKVVSLLNPYKDRIIACRGNCEAEVDQMLLDFPCLNDYSLFVEGTTTFFSTHGHLYTADNFPLASTVNVFLSGHTHLWVLEKKEHLTICNPGSITLPKENRPATYATYEDGKLSIIDFNQEVIKQISIN